MEDAFTVLWTQNTCRALREAGRVGQCPPVAFSGIHGSLPSWTSVDVGDEVFALNVHRCVVYVVSQLRVLDKRRRDCCGPEPIRYGAAFPGHEDWSMLGAHGCSAAAVHVHASPVRFDVPVPAELLAGLTWRNARGKTRHLKHVVDGRLTSSVSLQGGVYRLTNDSADALAALVDDALAPASVRASV